MIGKIGEAAVDAGPDLVEMLHDENKYIRFRALESLSRLGTGAYSLVPAIAEHLDDHASVVWSGFFDGLQDPANTSELEAEAWHGIPAAALAAIQAITGHHEKVYSKNWWLEWIQNHPTGSTGR